MSSTIISVAEPVYNKVLPSDKTGLPWEVWQMILSWLSVTDLCHVARVCRTWNELVNSVDALRWKELYLACNEWRHPFWPLNTKVEPPSWRQAYRDQYIATTFWKRRHKHETDHTSCTFFFKRTCLHKTIHVGAGLEHENLKSALGVANAYDRIVVHPGIYDEQFEITAKIPFELIGDGELGSIILVVGIQQVALTARLSNLVLRAPWFTSFIVMINSGYLQIDKCILEEGMICAQSPSTVHIKFCTFRHATVILQHMNTSIIENCEFSQSYSANIIIEGQPKTDKNWAYNYLREQTDAIFHQKRSMHRKKHGLKNTTSMTSTLHSSFTTKSLTTGNSTQMYDVISHDPSCNFDDPGATFLHPNIFSGRHPSIERDGMVGCGDLQSMYQEPDDPAPPPSMTKSSLSLPVSRSNHSKTVHGPNHSLNAEGILPTDAQGSHFGTSSSSSSKNAAVTKSAHDKEYVGNYPLNNAILPTKPKIYLSQRNNSNVNDFKMNNNVGDVREVGRSQSFTAGKRNTSERNMNKTSSLRLNVKDFKDFNGSSQQDTNQGDNDNKCVGVVQTEIPPISQRLSVSEEPNQNHKEKRKDVKGRNSKTSGQLSLGHHSQVSSSKSRADSTQTQSKHKSSAAISVSVHVNENITVLSDEPVRNDAHENTNRLQMAEKECDSCVKGKDEDGNLMQQSSGSQITASTAEAEAPTTADDRNFKSFDRIKDSDNLKKSDTLSVPVSNGHSSNHVISEQVGTVGNGLVSNQSHSTQDCDSVRNRDEKDNSEPCAIVGAHSKREETNGFSGHGNGINIKLRPKLPSPSSDSALSQDMRSDLARPPRSVDQYSLRRFQSDDETAESDDDISILDELDRSEDEDDYGPNQYDTSSSTDSSNDEESMDYTGSGNEFSSSEESVIMLPHLREFDLEPLDHSTSPRGVEAEITSINSDCTRPVPVNVSEDEMMSSFVDQIHGVLIHQCRMNHSKGGLMVTLQAHAIISECEINNVGYGIRCIHSSRVVILKNKIHHCRTSGIFMRLAAAGLIAGNDIHSNNEAGIDIRKNADPLVQFNQIHHGKRSGVVVLGSGRGQIKKNDIFSNTEAGVYILYGGNPTVSENYIYEGRAAGVAVNAKGKGYIVDNVIRGNQWGGIDVRNSSCPVLSGNSIINGLSDGIVIGVGGRGNIENNNITGNSGSGIWMMSAKNLNIHGNQICCNGHCGVMMLDKSTSTMDVHLNQLMPAGITHHNFPQYEDCFIHPEPKAPWAILQYNNISHNKSQGIVIEIQDEVHVSHNAVHGNLKDGIVMLQDAPALVVGNSITHNTGHGLVTSTRNKVKVIGNGIYDNTHHGMLCQNECVVEENDIIGQSGCAVMADGTSCVEMVNNRLCSSVEPAVRGGKSSRVTARKNKIYDKGGGDFLCLGELMTSHNTLSRPTLVLEYAKKSSEKDFGRTDFLFDPPPRPHSVPPPAATTIPTHRVTVVTKVMMPSTEGCEQGSKFCTVL